jgi:hypothetical protein
VRRGASGIAASYEGPAHAHRPLPTLHRTRLDSPTSTGFFFGFGQEFGRMAAGCVVMVLGLLVIAALVVLNFSNR